MPTTGNKDVVWSVKSKLAMYAGLVSFESRAQATSNFGSATSQEKYAWASILLPATQIALLIRFVHLYSIAIVAKFAVS